MHIILKVFVKLCKIILVFAAKKCGRNEEFTKCSNECPPTCANPMRKPCVLRCKPGCDCKKGFIRAGEHGPCIPIKECPPKCKN